MSKRLSTDDNPTQETLDRLRHEVSEWGVTPPPEGWPDAELVEHPCGYGAKAGEEDWCYHHGCWDDREIIQRSLHEKNPRLLNGYGYGRAR
jgi:hypothetical protein